MYCVMNKGGYILRLEAFFEELMTYGVIFVGEVHGSRECHEAELAILDGLSKRDPDLVLAMEMFERDVQDVVDDYLGGVISEKEFLELSRPWHNYPLDYRPLVELARARGIQLIAANVPRRAAARIAEANEVSPEILGADSRYVPDVVHYDSGDYHRRFAETVAHMGPSAPMKRENLDGLYKAQVVKDAVMAASLEPFLHRRVLFCCGHFHCDYHLGIPYQLHVNHPELKTTVLTFASRMEQLPMTELSKVGDYIWIVE